MRGLIFGFSITLSIAAAAELGIAGQLANGGLCSRQKTPSAASARSMR
jgi:hypothetical protein